MGLPPWGFQAPFPSGVIRLLPRIAFLSCDSEPAFHDNPWGGATSISASKPRYSFLTCSQDWEMQGLSTQYSSNWGRSIFSRVLQVFGLERGPHPVHTEEWWPLDPLTTGRGVCVSFQLGIPTRVAGDSELKTEPHHSMDHSLDRHFGWRLESHTEMHGLKRKHLMHHFTDEDKSYLKGQDRELTEHSRLEIYSKNLKF